MKLRLWFFMAVLLFATPVCAGGSFVPAQSGPAVQQPNSSVAVGTLAAGQSYRLLKTGGPGGVWCKLQLPQGAGWVLCSAGTQGDAPAQRPPGSTPPPKPEPAAGNGRTAASFDYYLLSLSWSPSFCASRGDNAPEQCGLDRHYGFVVHGLWPEGEDGGYPASCSAAGRLDEALITRALELMPSRGLILHEWSKHGTCSGLSPEDYFGKLRTAFQSIKIPAALQKPQQPLTVTLEQIEAMFIESNPGMNKDMLAVQCRRNVSEIRFCMDKELRLRACGAKVRDNCPGQAIFPPIR